MGFQGPFVKVYLSVEEKELLEEARIAAGGKPMSKFLRERLLKSLQVSGEIPGVEWSAEDVPEGGGRKVQVSMRGKGSKGKQPSRRKASGE